MIAIVVASFLGGALIAAFALLMRYRFQIGQLKAEIAAYDRAGRVTRKLTAAEAGEIAEMLDGYLDLMPSATMVEYYEPFTPNTHRHDRVAEFRDLFREHAKCLT